ncbi:Uncharacterised protein [Fusobacterium necrogenes]|uniref:Uncharacterized protein n=1 Tax=Fusobacterium necrogenes TaxID=858 RepID=A0A377GVY9_9FUSO|nr:hypothetical protein [Fusobacterium necrogenes]STO30691.1 Uncharacterised protein [Fusobacterium necrogenes]
MKILIRNKKWETSFKDVKLICEVTGRNRVFDIKFSYSGNDVSIKTNNLDKTFRYLESIFNNNLSNEVSNENKIAI